MSAEVTPTQIADFARAALQASGAVKSIVIATDGLYVVVTRDPLTTEALEAALATLRP